MIIKLNWFQKFICWVVLPNWMYNDLKQIGFKIEKEKS